MRIIYDGYVPEQGGGVTHDEADSRRVGGRKRDRRRALGPRGQRDAAAPIAEWTVEQGDARLDARRTAPHRLARLKPLNRE